jgi:sugar fermentation stimulation protein A
MAPEPPMIFPSALRPARLIRRYKRFLADVELEDGAGAIAHCANPGAMTGLTEPGARIWLAPAPSGNKLAWSWVLTELTDGPRRHFVGINTLHANALAAEALAAGQIPELAGYGEVRREVAYGPGRREAADNPTSRVDFVLGQSGRPDCYVEVKSVTLRRGELAEFPDSVTARGAKHMDDLARIRAGGARAVVLFVAQRGDCAAFAVAADIDGAYAAAFQRAQDAGVEVLCYACQVATAGIAIHRPLPMAGPHCAPATATYVKKGRAVNR